MASCEWHRPCAIVILIGLGAAVAAAETGREADQRAIQAAAQAYQEALSRGDAAAIAALWAPDGDIIDDLGNRLTGSASLVLEAAPAGAPSPGAETAEPRLQSSPAGVRISETTLRFVAEDVAIEDGAVEVRPSGGGMPLNGRFTAVWVRHDGTWKISALRECGGPEPAGAALLQELEWMVGDWHVVQNGATAVPGAENDVPGGGGADVDVSVRWNDTHTFLLREMTVSAAATGGEPLVISQRIGWDPLNRRIRSWAFGSDGSHGEATWIRDGGSWLSQAVSVSSDGNQTTTLTVYTPEAADRCTVRTLPTHVGAEHAPQLFMTMIRKPTALKNQKTNNPTTTDPKTTEDLR